MPPQTAAELKGAVEQILKMFPQMNAEQAAHLCQSAQKGGEIAQCGGIDDWLEKRVRFSTVVLDADDYLTALTHALRLAPRLAPTDYGTSRQRDLGQLWTDIARGFLGEIGFAKFVKERFDCEVVLDYSQGPLQNYLPSDIAYILLPDGTRRAPQLKPSIKTTKFRSIWLDIPGAQFDRSDIFILVKLGISREHFIAFLKDISFIKDKLLAAALQRSVIDQSEADSMWDSLPAFGRIPCYIAGFLDKRHVTQRPAVFREARNRKGQVKGYVVQSYIGWVRDGKPDVQNIDLPDSSLSWSFESIGTFTASEGHFVANAGSLAYSEKEWKGLLSDIVGEG